jgi:hypothetical protein
MKPRIIAALIASLGMAGALGGPVHAQSDDVQQDGQEARLILPRLASGELNTSKLRTEVRRLFRNGARDVRIRDLDLSPRERQQITELVRQLSGEFVSSRVRMLDEGGRLHIVLRDEQEAAEDGHGDRHRDDRAERREDLRADQQVERDAVGQRPQPSERVDRVERDAVEQRPEPSGRVERVERTERTERSDRVERPERKERPERHEKVERLERPEKPEKLERPEKVERAERPEKPERKGR